MKKSRNEICASVSVRAVQMFRVQWHLQNVKYTTLNEIKMTVVTDAGFSKRPSIILQTRNTKITRKQPIYPLGEKIGQTVTACRRK